MERELRQAGEIVDLLTGRITQLPADTKLYESSHWALPSNKFLLRNEQGVWRVIDPTGAIATVVTAINEPYLNHPMI